MKTGTLGRTALTTMAKLVVSSTQSWRCSVPTTRQLVASSSSLRLPSDSMAVMVVVSVGVRSRTPMRCSCRTCGSSMARTSMACGGRRG